jgi:hypothetical protein
MGITTSTTAAGLIETLTADINALLMQRVALNGVFSTQPVKAGQLTVNFGETLPVTAGVAINAGAPTASVLTSVTKAATVGHYHKLYPIDSLLNSSLIYEAAVEQIVGGLAKTYDNAICILAVGFTSNSQCDTTGSTDLTLDKFSECYGKLQATGYAPPYAAILHPVTFHKLAMDLAALNSLPKADEYLQNGYMGRLWGDLDIFVSSYVTAGGIGSSGSGYVNLICSRGAIGVAQNTPLVNIVVVPDITNTLGISVYGEMFFGCCEVNDQGGIAVLDQIG